VVAAAGKDWASIGKDWVQINDGTNRKLPMHGAEHIECEAAPRPGHPGRYEVALVDSGRQAGAAAGTPAKPLFL
jgi:hypothetical protein